MTESSKLISPYGDRLVNLVISEDERPHVVDHAKRLTSIQVSERIRCDLELLANGAFSPLDRFMGKIDFESCVHEMRTANGMVFPIPVSLPVSADADIKLDTDIALRDARNDLLAIMTVEEIYEWHHSEFSELVLRTNDPRHPLNSEIPSWGSMNISGKLRVIAAPRHFDFRHLRFTPEQTRSKLDSLGKEHVVAFQTRNPIHRGHEEICRRAAALTDGTLLLHPTVGVTRPGDVDVYSRVRTYETLLNNYFADENVLLGLLPLAMRMAGPREAVWHMIIRRNFGADHFIVGRDHASPGLNSLGKPYYGSSDAQDLALEFEDEIGVKALAFAEMVYLPDENRYAEFPMVKKPATVYRLSGTTMREQYLQKGEVLPDWFMRPEVADILRQNYPPMDKQGVCVWFTGLSGSGKSTIAEILTVFLNEDGRAVTLLDGDVVRTHLSKGLGFSREDRDANILRIGFVAAEVVRHGGIAICAAVSPYIESRSSVRGMFDDGRFIEIFVDTPLGVCEQRDSKGMYEKARRGEIAGFTGIDDPYEAPENADIVLDTVEYEAEENACKILQHLQFLGFVRGKGVDV